MSDVIRKWKFGNELPNIQLEVLIKVRDIIKQLEADGWYVVSVKGDHRHLKHPGKAGKAGKVTVPGHPSDSLAPKTLASIQRQAGWR